MKKLLLAFVLFIGTAGLFAQTVNENYQDGKIWFKLKDNVATLKSSVPGEEMLPFLVEKLSQFQVTRLSRPFVAAKSSRALQLTYLLEFSDFNQVDELINVLSASSEIEYAEKVPLDKPCLTPNDPSFSSQWSLTKIGAPAAWNLSTGSPTIVVAVVDDAVLTTHPDLAPNVWSNPGETANNGIDDDGNGYIDDKNGYDVADNDANPNPPTSAFGHGTHVAGIVAARSNNGTGVASIGYNIRMMAVKATNSASVVTNGYDGILYAVAAGADVINMSWGGPTFSNTGQNIINYANSQGCILVAAAGNDNVNTQFYPAAYNHVISVAATNSNDQKASFSNYGSWIDVSAPGQNIYSTVVGNTYGNKSGTSMASPLVAGLMGLMKSLNPGLSPAALTNCLLTTATNINSLNPSYNNQLGSGRIDAYAAMNCIAATLNFPPQADFVGSPTNIAAGASVTYTNLSTYNPTSFTWTFQGGTPATFTGANPPPVFYYTAGTYNVTLTATNANGSDTETKSSYITVNSSNGCDTITNTFPTDTVYTWTLGAGNGYLGGHNTYAMNDWADFYSNYAPNTHIQGAVFYFVRAKTQSNTSSITVTVWDDNGPTGKPGTILATKSVRIKDIVANITPTGFIPTEVLFNTPVPINGNFYLGFTVTPAPGDTVAVALSQDFSGTARPNTAWTRYLGTWNGVDQIFTGAPKMSHFMFPLVTTMPVTGSLTPNNPSVCEGDSIQFTRSGNGVSSHEWYFTGSLTSYTTDQNPYVSFTSPGSDTAYLVSYNGCGFYHIDSTTITVKPKPSVSVAASPSTEICLGNQVNLTASGATTYTWTPPTGLNTTTGPSVIASPTTNTTYVVTGTLNGCSNSSPLPIKVLNPPVADVQVSDTVVCTGEVVLFDGSLSVDADDFTWAFPTGSPSNSTASTDSVSFSTAGTKNVQLTVTNTCGTDVLQKTIEVEVCTDIHEMSAGNFNAWYSGDAQMIIIKTEDLQGDWNAVVYDASGRIVAEELIRLRDHAAQSEINVNHLPSGFYLISFTNGNQLFNGRFVK